MAYLLPATSSMLHPKKGGLLLQRISRKTRPFSATAFSNCNTSIASRNNSNYLGIIGSVQWPNAMTCIQPKSAATSRLFGSASEHPSYYTDEDTLGLGLSHDKDLQIGQEEKIKITTLAACERVDEYYGTSESWASDEEYSLKQRWTPQLTKIVATIGPTSEQADVMQKVIRCGMRIMRLNFSHATVEEVELRMKNIRGCKGHHGLSEMEERFSHGSSNLRAVLLDTRGPEIRTGKLRNDVSGKDTIKLETGAKISLHTDTKWIEAGSTETDLFIDYATLSKSLAPGKRVLLDDGAISLSVDSIVDEHTVECTILNNGELRSRAGVNLPGVETDLPALTAKDKIDIKYGLTKDIDYIAASFVQNAAGVREIRRYVRHVMTNELGIDADYPEPLIISKIETMSALRNFHEILMESDGIMVARGDLGVEIPIMQITNAQKEMVAACNAVGKPVIVATQMLESMAKNPRPTRAEVADVTNAVYDGADCVMLSGESAKGKYPVETVKMMNEIILTAERFASALPELAGVGMRGHAWWMKPKEQQHVQTKSLASGILKGKTIQFRSALDSVAKAAVMAAEERKVQAIIVLTLHGFMPRLISAYRPSVPIVAFCPSEKVGRQLMIHRGIHPVLGASGISPSKLPSQAIKDAKQMGFVDAGDEVVIVTLEPTEGVGNFASMKVCTVPPNTPIKSIKQ